MNTDENSAEIVKEKPQIYFTKLKFNDDTELSLEKNSIVVFTGANNSGKSQVLRDIEICVDDSNHTRMVVVKSNERNYCGEIDEEKFLEENFKVNKQGMYQLLESGNAFDTSSLKKCWSNHTLHNSLHRIFFVQVFHFSLIYKLGVFLLDCF